MVEKRSEEQNNRKKPYFQTNSMDDSTEHSIEGTGKTSERNSHSKKEEILRRLLT